MAGVPASTSDADLGNESYSDSQPCGKRSPCRRLDYVGGPVSIEKNRNMRALKSFLFAAVIASTAGAQVEKVAMRTTGISCGVCAAVSEVNFKRIPGIDKVKISLSQEAIMLTYKQDAVFSTQQIRDVLKPLDVGVLQFQIGARGQIQEVSGQRVFIAGRDRFRVVNDPRSSSPPMGTPIRIEAILNDHVEPMEVKILDFQPAPK